MLNIMWNSAAAMNAQQEKLNSISNNLANVNTVGYKSQDVSFQDLVSESLNKQGYPFSKDNKSRMTGTGVKSTGVMRSDEQGALTNTGSKTDLAIDGEGYFKVLNKDGNAFYTRDGNMKISLDGKLTDKNGNLVEIKFNDEYVSSRELLTNENILVNMDGTVLLKQNANTKEIGKITLFKPVGQDSFISVGNNMYAPKDNTVKINEVNNSSIMQGFTEASNVDVTKQMTDMIMTQRAFEFSSRAMKTADEMWGMANNLRGR